MLQEFFSLNRKLCLKLEKFLPQVKPRALDLYKQKVAQFMNSKSDQTIVDVGGGNLCPFAKYKEPLKKTTIIAVDLSKKAMKNNRLVDEKRVANISHKLPFKNEAVDIFTSRWVFEHLKEPEKFIALSKSKLRQNGLHIHLFASKWAPFALLSQALPKYLPEKILHFLNPKIKDKVGMASFYNQCSYSAMRRLFEKHGFEIIETHVSYYQSQYYDFFLPLFLLSAFYEILLKTLSLKNLAAYVLIVARKSH